MYYLNLDQNENLLKVIKTKENEIFEWNRQIKQFEAKIKNYELFETESIIIK